MGTVGIMLTQEMGLDYLKNDLSVHYYAVLSVISVLLLPTSPESRHGVDLAATSTSHGKCKHYGTVAIKTLEERRFLVLFCDKLFGLSEKPSTESTGNPSSRCRSLTTGTW